MNPLCAISGVELFDFMRNHKIILSDKTEFYDMLKNTNINSLAIVQHSLRDDKYWRYMWILNNEWRQYVFDWHFRQWAKELTDINDETIYEFNDIRFRAEKLRDDGTHFRFDKILV